MTGGIPKVKLGSQGLEVSEQGLGCMGMSYAYGPPKPEKDMIELIHKAVGLGITFIDTADMYGPHTNEVLVGKALKGIRDKVQLATKFANSFDEKGNFQVRGDPEYVKSACEASLKRLDVDYIDLYYQHRVDVNTPIEITVGAMKELVKEGKVKYLGLSEAPSADIRRAHAVHPITAVQLEWSLWTRDIEEDIIPTCRELGIGIVPYSPLGRGFFSGVSLADLPDGDSRKGGHYPRFKPENVEKNKQFLERLKKIGERHGASAGQVALAWVQHRGVEVVPIPGTTKPKNLEENVGALKLKLTEAELKEIADSVPMEDVAGDRYSEANLGFTWRNSVSKPLSAWKSS